METHTTKSITCLVCSGTTVRFFQEKNACTIYICDTCKVRFVYPIPEALEKIYEENYFDGAENGFGYVDYDADKEPMRPAFQKYVRLIRKVRPDSNTLLDVGAATGFFLDIARTDGFDVSGVEISDFAAGQGRKKGIPITTGTLVDVATGPYDVITMLDVIEHVSDPMQEILHARALLTERGLLVLNTPDAGSIWARVFGKQWHLIVPPEHLYYFNRKNMSALLEREGFRVLTITTIGKRFTLQYIFRTLHGWLGWALWDTLARWSTASLLTRITLPINLGDNMFLIAEKI